MNVCRKIPQVFVSVIKTSPYFMTRKVSDYTVPEGPHFRNYNFINNWKICQNGAPVPKFLWFGNCYKRENSFESGKKFNNNNFPVYNFQWIYWTFIYSILFHLNSGTFFKLTNKSSILLIVENTKLPFYLHIYCWY